MSTKPKKLYWVDMKLSEKGKHWSTRKSAGVRGGKRSSLRACEEARATILKADPEAQVDIYEAEVNWKKIE